jgi:hypothetical protein
MEVLAAKDNDLQRLCTLSFPEGKKTRLYLRPSYKCNPTLQFDSAQQAELG